MTEAPVRIRVAQDAEGFWTCREAVSGSQEYVRADIVEELRAALEGFNLTEDSIVSGTTTTITLCVPHTTIRKAADALSRLAEVSNG